MIRTAPGAPAPRKRRVRVWFGDHAIMDHIDSPAMAKRYEHAMRRRFISLRVTNDPVGVIAPGVSAPRGESKTWAATS